MGAVAEFVADKTMGWRVMDGAPVQITAGVVVRQVSSPFPHQLPDGRIQKRIRFLAIDDQWYELPHDSYLKATGAVSDDRVGKALLAAGLAAGAIVLLGEAAKGARPPS